MFGRNHLCRVFWSETNSYIEANCETVKIRPFIPFLVKKEINGERPFIDFEDFVSRPNQYNARAKYHKCCLKAYFDSDLQSVKTNPITYLIFLLIMFGIFDSAIHRRYAPSSRIIFNIWTSIMKTLFPKWHTEIELTYHNLFKCGRNLELIFTVSTGIFPNFRTPCLYSNPYFLSHSKFHNERTQLENFSEELKMQLYVEIDDSDK